MLAYAIALLVVVITFLLLNIRNSAKIMVRELYDIMDVIRDLYQGSQAKETERAESIKKSNERIEDILKEIAFNINWLVTEESKSFAEELSRIEITLSFLADRYEQDHGRKGAPELPRFDDLDMLRDYTIFRVNSEPAIESPAKEQKKIPPDMLELLRHRPVTQGEFIACFQYGSALRREAKRAWGIRRAPWIWFKEHETLGEAVDRYIKAAKTIAEEEATEPPATTRPAI
jgi:hypothetical protein